MSNAEFYQQSDYDPFSHRTSAEATAPAITYAGPDDPGCVTSSTAVSHDRPVQYTSQAQLPAHAQTSTQSPANAPLGAAATATTAAAAITTTAPPAPSFGTLNSGIPSLELQSSSPELVVQPHQYPGPGQAPGIVPPQHPPFGGPQRMPSHQLPPSPSTLHGSTLYDEPQTPSTLDPHQQQLHQQQLFQQRLQQQQHQQQQQQQQQFQQPHSFSPAPTAFLPNGYAQQPLGMPMMQSQPQPQPQQLQQQQLQPRPSTQLQPSPKPRTNRNRPGRKLPPPRLLPPQ